MNRGEEEENWKREREIGSFKSFVSSDGLHIYCFSSISHFLQKILPTSANTQPPYPFADMFDMYLKMVSNRF